MGTFKEPLNPWINPVIDAATSADDFLLTDVRKKKMTVYIGILPNKLAESRVIVNLFFSQLINQNTKELPQGNPDLKHQCLLLMDEFTSIGRVEIIAHSVSYMAGYNIRLFPIIQSVAQLDAVYGKEYARTIITNHALQIIYTPREQQDANEYSEMLGLYHGEKEERQPRTRTQRIGKRRAPRADAAAGIERNESGQRNHPLRRHGTSGEGEQDSLLSRWNVYQAAEGGGEGGLVERRAAIAIERPSENGLGLVFRRIAVILR